MFFGTRGSVPVSSKSQMKYGGNSTSIMIQSDCLPENNYLAVDAGSGFVPMSNHVMKEQGGNLFDTNGGVAMTVLFTHYHHDHTQGLFLSPLTFIKSVQMSLLGPSDHNIGPREMMLDLMKPPYFPVDFKEVASHFNFKKFDHPASNVVIFHPIGGKKVLDAEQYERFANNGGHVPVGKSGKYPIAECLVVKMFKSNHPEQTISYRFEEHPTGKVFVFLTDHENQSGIPSALRTHISAVDLLVLDSQYAQQKYDTFTAGFGHGTGPYCADLAFQCKVKKLGLTHHDPSNSDDQVEDILSEAKAKLAELIVSSSEKKPPLQEKDIFSCYDYQIVEV